MWKIHWKRDRLQLFLLYWLRQSLTVWIITNCGKVFKRWEYQTILPASWGTCKQVKKQQLKLDMEQQTGSKLGNEFVKAVYCHPAYLTYMQSESESELTQLCPTLCNPLDCSPPGSSVHGILQARILEWVAISFSRGSSRRREWIQVSCIAGRCFNLWAIYEMSGWMNHNLESRLPGEISTSDM